MAASNYHQNDDFKHETARKRTASYDEDIVNQLETFGYATRAECINASYQCVDYKDPNEVIQRIDEHSQSMSHSMSNSPQPLYHNKRHPQIESPLPNTPNIILRKWSAEESQPQSPTNASPIPDFMDDNDNNDTPLVKQNTGSFLELMESLTYEHEEDSFDEKLDIDNNTDRVQLYTVIRDITDNTNHNDTAKQVLLLTHPLVTSSYIILKCLEQRLYRDDHDMNCRMSTSTNSGHNSSPSVTLTTTANTTTTNHRFPSFNSFSNLSEIALSATTNSLRDRNNSYIGNNTSIFSTFSIQAKVIEFIRYWMIEYWDNDWATNAKLRNYCKTFIRRYKENEKVNLHANEINKGIYLIDLLEKTMNKCMKSQQSQKLSHIFGDKIGCNELLSPRISPRNKLMKSTPEQPPMLTLKSTSSNKSANSLGRGGSKYLNEISKDIVGMDSKLIAKQLTLMQFNLYCEIHARECLNQAWKDNNKKYIIAPNISLYIDQFNKITKWIQLSILNAKNIKHRSQTIKRWIKIEEYLYKINNLMGVAAVKCALNSNAIYKLRNAWQIVSKKHNKHMKQHLEICKKYDRNNWKNLRLFENKCNLTNKIPLIPYFPMFATDMIGIELTNKKRVKNGTINFKALCNINDRIISHLMHQKIEYSTIIKLDATIQRYISNEMSKANLFGNEDQIFEKSKLIIIKDKKELNIESRQIILSDKQAISTISHFKSVQQSQQTHVQKQSAQTDSDRLQEPQTSAENDTTNLAPILEAKIVTNERLSQNASFDKLKNKIQELEKQLKHSTKTNRLLLDQVEELQKTNRMQMDEVITENVELIESRNKWKQMHNAKNEENERLQNELSELQQNNNLQHCLYKMLCLV